MVICPDCGNDVPESKFCKNCGAYIKDVKPNSQPQGKTRFCSNCGHEIDGDYRFCPECGADIPNNDEYNVEEVKAEDVIESDDSAESSGVEDVVPVEDDAEVKQDNSLSLPVQSSDKVRFCSNCGYRIVGDYKFCPECGHDLSGNVMGSNTQAVRSSSGQKNILLAIILSVFLPGLGQIYLGLDHKGAIFLIAYVISAILILILIGFLLCFIIWIWALIDTIISTNALNRGEEVQDKLL